MPERTPLPTQQVFTFLEQKLDPRVHIAKQRMLEILPAAFEGVTLRSSYPTTLELQVDDRKYISIRSRIGEALLEASAMITRPTQNTEGSVKFEIPDDQIADKNIGLLFVPFAYFPLIRPAPPLPNEHPGHQYWEALHLQRPDLYIHELWIPQGLDCLLATRVGKTLYTAKGFSVMELVEMQRAKQYSSGKNVLLTLPHASESQQNAELAFNKQFCAYYEMMQAEGSRGHVRKRPTVITSNFGLARGFS